MTIQNEDILTSPRMGGSVQRYHTWPTIQRQTVADHTFHVLRIYWHLFGEVSPEACAYLIFHDVPEVVVGDPPHPIKLHNPPLKYIYDGLEDAALEDMIGEELAMRVVGEVTDLERVRMKMCDLLEMAEFAAVETMMGNRAAAPIFEKIDAALRGLPSSEYDRARVQWYWSNHITRFMK